MPRGRRVPSHTNRRANGRRTDSSSTCLERTNGASVVRSARPSADGRSRSVEPPLLPRHVLAAGLRGLSKWSLLFFHLYPIPEVFENGRIILANLPNGEHPLAGRLASEQRAPFRAVGSGGRSARSLNNARCASKRTNSATVLGDNGAAARFRVTVG